MLCDLVVCTSRLIVMGQTFQRTWEACSDPEGTANKVRRAKQQRAVITKYTEIFEAIESALATGDKATAREYLQQLQQQDREVDNRGAQPGDFRKALNEHREWPELAKRRAAIDSQTAAGGA